MIAEGFERGEELLTGTPAVWWFYVGGHDAEHSPDRAERPRAAANSLPRGCVPVETAENGSAARRTTLGQYGTVIGSKSSPPVAARAALAIAASPGDRPGRGTGRAGTYCIVITLAAYARQST